MSSSHLIMYPRGCEEVNESLDIDELKKRLKKIWASIIRQVASSSADNVADNQDANNDFQGLSLHLSAPHFLNHEDKNVRLLIGCCLIELFKMYCPSNPFVSLCDENELIINVVVFLYRTGCQMKQIKSKEDVAYEKLSYFCQSLISTDLIAVCHSNPEGQRACYEYFKFLFAIARTVHLLGWEETPEKNLRCLVNAAIKVVTDEIELLGTDSINLVLEYLIQPKKEHEPDGNKIAVQFLSACKDQLKKIIEQMLKEILVMPASADDSQEQGDQQLTKQSGIRDELIFSLIYELHKVDPCYADPVLPVLQFKLLSTQERERKRACRLMVKLFSESSTDLINTQSELWKTFLGRFVDVCVDVRRICVASVPQLLAAYPHLRDTLVGLLRSRTLDLDVPIRDCIVSHMIALAKQEISSLPEDYLAILIDRSLDKDQSVRRAALTGLASIYKAYITDDKLIRSGNKAVWSRVSQCANAIMHLYYQENNWDRIAVERHFKASLVPYSLEAKDRMRALLRCFCSFNNHSSKALVEMLKTQYHVTQLTSSIMDLITAEPDKLSPENESTLMAKIRSLAVYFQQTDKATEHLRKFFNLLHGEKPMRQLLGKVLSKDCPCGKATKLLRSLLESHDQVLRIGEKAKKTDNTTSYRITVKTLLERVGPVLFDRESVTSLVNLLISGREDPANILPGEACAVTQHKGLLLLNMLCFYFPHTVDLDDTFDYVAECLNDESMELDTVEVCLRLLLNLTPLFTEERQDAIDAVVPRLRRLCDDAKLSTSASGSLAKMAAKCLTGLLATGLAPQIGEELDSLVADAAKLAANSELCVPRLEALGQILKHSAAKYRSKVANLITKRLPEFVKLAPTAPASAASKSASNKRKPAAAAARDLSRWLPTESLSQLTQVKLASIRCLCHYLIGLALSSASSSAADCTSDTAKSVVDLLHHVILHDGDPSVDASGAAKSAALEAGEMAQLRLCAAKALLRICKRQALVPLLDCEKFQTLALVVCDPCKEVRHAVLSKLHRGLVKFKLPLQFMAMFAYVPDASDDKELQQVARTYYSRCVSARRDYLASKQAVIANDRVTFFAVLPDYTLPYAVHLLANDPEFESPKDARQLTRLKAGLRFLLEPLIVKGENFGFLRRMLETMRLARDAQRPDDELANQKLHAVCDLALGLIVTKSANFSISNYPIEPQLPKRLFLLPASREATAAPEFASLPAGLQFSPPKNPAAIKQGLIPPDRVRLGKRAAAAAAATLQSPASPPAPAKAKPVAAAAAAGGLQAKSATAAAASKAKSPSAAAAPSTVAKTPPPVSPPQRQQQLKSPTQSQKNSQPKSLPPAQSASPSPSSSKPKPSSAAQNGRSAAPAVKAGKIKKAAATKTATKNKPPARPTPSPSPSPSPSPPPQPSKVAKGRRGRPKAALTESQSLSESVSMATKKPSATSKAKPNSSIVNRKRRAVASVDSADEEAESAVSQSTLSPSSPPPPPRAPPKKRRGLVSAVSPSTISTTPTPGSGSGISGGGGGGRLSRAAKSRSIEALQLSRRT